MSKNSDSSIDIRSIQQYLYCAHRWGLITTDCSWAENAFVAKGNLVHQRTDSGETTFSHSKITVRNVKVFHDDLDIYGVADCMELIRDEKGVYVKKYNGYFSVRIVEYKPTAPKSGQERYEDKMQLLAQKLCIDNALGCDSQTYFYYADANKRSQVVFSEDDKSFLENTVADMKRLFAAHIIPEKKTSQYCSGCSLSDICFPRIL